jgi:hypothetical protein
MPDGTITTDRSGTRDLKVEKCNLTKHFPSFLDFYRKVEALEQQFCLDTSNDDLFIQGNLLTAILKLKFIWNWSPVRTQLKAKLPANDQKT